jgi:hypothetical protein
LPKIIFAGAGEFGLPTLKAIVDAGHPVVHVFSQPDRLRAAAESSCRRRSRSLLWITSFLPRAPETSTPNRSPLLT